jgi:hypothetical protein
MELFLGRNGCERAASLCYGCDTAANQAPTGRWFITMGHPGFNSPANNRGGYASQAAAAAAIARYGSKRPRR